MGGGVRVDARQSLSTEGGVGAMGPAINQFQPYDCSVVVLRQFSLVFYVKPSRIVRLDTLK